MAAMLEERGAASAATVGASPAGSPTSPTSSARPPTWPGSGSAPGRARPRAAAHGCPTRRHGLTEERVLELMTDGVIHVATTGRGRAGERPAVYDLGHHRFGRPARITARVGLGREGVINVERQSGLSGPTHDKGVQHPLRLPARDLRPASAADHELLVTFEQSYGGVDGDSASSTEVYAILSALAEPPAAPGPGRHRLGRPVRAGPGHRRRQREDRGVLPRVPVPRADRHAGGDDPVEPTSATCSSSRRSSRRSPGAVSTSWRWPAWSEGIELLTGVPAGTWVPGEGWPADTVYGRCQRRLDEMNRLMRQAGKNGAEAVDNGQPTPER